MPHASTLTVVVPSSAMNGCAAPVGALYSDVISSRVHRVFTCDDVLVTGLMVLPATPVR